MAQAQKPDSVFQRYGRVHLYRRGCQFRRVLAFLECGSGENDCSNTGWTVPSQAEDCWLPTSFASFPFTSPPVCRRVPPDSVSTLQQNDLPHSSTKTFLRICRSIWTKSLVSLITCCLSQWILLFLWIIRYSTFIIVSCSSIYVWISHVFVICFSVPIALAANISSTLNLFMFISHYYVRLCLGSMLLYLQKRLISEWNVYKRTGYWIML